MAEVGKNIMVGFDGSEGGRRALDRAAALAGYGSSLTVVVVSRPDANGDRGRLLSATREQLAARLISAYALNPIGDPAEELLKAATSLRADMLVIGARSGGHRDGAVASQLLARAPCDVLVVR